MTPPICASCNANGYGAKVALGRGLGQIEDIVKPKTGPLMRLEAYFAGGSRNLPWRDE